MRCPVLWRADYGDGTFEIVKTLTHRIDPQVYFGTHPPVQKWIFSLKLWGDLSRSRKFRHAAAGYGKVDQDICKTLAIAVAGYVVHAGNVDCLGTAVTALPFTEF
jgi:hypothetical protein